MSISLGLYSKILWQYIKPQGWKAILLAVLLLSSISLQLVNPLILRQFIDGAQAGTPVQGLLVTAVMFLVIGLVNQVLGAAATYMGADVGWRATNMLRADLAKHLLTLDMSFHNERTPGEMVERIDGDVTSLANFFSQFLVRVAGAMLLLVGTLIVLFTQDWRVGLAMTAYAAAGVWLLTRVRNIAIGATTDERESSAQMYGFIEERLMGLDDIRANGAAGYMMRRFYEVTRRWFRQSHNAWMRRSTIWLLMMSLFTVGDQLALGLGIWLFTTGAITLGTIYLFYQYTNMLITPIEQITQEMQELQKAGASIGRIADLLDKRTNVVDGRGDVIPDGPLTVSFEDVSFAYADSAPLIQNLNLTLRQGKVVGLLGRTGSGKSTLTRLLLRLYDPSQGSIRLGGVDLRDATISDLRQRIGMVTQDVQLFQASVRQNLTFFNPNIPDAHILKVLADFGLQDWFAMFPDGLDTILAANGGGLSAGEAQLLALIRAFLQNPGLIILDEPSSRLDPATERLLDTAIAKLLKGRTAIIIAHRLATVERADDILIMERGHVVEQGARSTLAANPRSRFYALLQTNLAETA